MDREAIKARLDVIVADLQALITEVGTEAKEMLKGHLSAALTELQAALAEDE